MADNPSSLGSHFVVVADVNAAALDRPIGRDGGTVTNFTGNFNGNGHVITINISTPGQNNVGLFATIGASGTVRNLEVRGSVTGGNNVGGIAGSVLGTGIVTNSASHVNVNGNGFVGGLVGNNNSGGTVAFSYAIGTISGDNRVGGLVGGNAGAVQNSYATGTVNGTGNQVGGLVGENIGGAIQMTYAMGRVTGHNFVGGLVGQMSGGSLSNSVVLSGNVDGNNHLGRAVGTTGGPVAINFVYARENMLVDGTLVNSVSNSSTEGADLSIATLSALWWNFRGFSSSEWEFTPMGVPFLKNVPNISSQNPFIPPVALMGSLSFNALSGGLVIPPITVPGGSDAAPGLLPPDDSNYIEDPYDPDMKLPEEDEYPDDDADEDSEEDEEESEGDSEEESDDEGLEDGSDGEENKPEGGGGENAEITPPEASPEAPENGGGEAEAEGLAEIFSSFSEELLYDSESNETATIQSILWNKNT